MGGWVYLCGVGSDTGSLELCTGATVYSVLDEVNPGMSSFLLFVTLIRRSDGGRGLQ